MAALSLSQLLDVAIGTPEVGAVNFTALHSLLQAMIGHLGLQDLPAQEPGHSLTPLLGEDQPAKAHPGLEKKGDKTEAWAQGTGQQPQEPGERLPGKDPLQGTTSSPQVTSVAADVGQMKKTEANESGISKAMALSQDLLEEIEGMKAVQSRMGEDIQMIQEKLGLILLLNPAPRTAVPSFQGNLQDTDSRLPGLHDQTTLDSDVKRLKERLSLYPAPEEEGSGGQSAPAVPHTSDLDTLHRGSSAPGLKAPGIEPVPRTKKGTSGTQPSSQGMHTGMQRTSVTPEKWAGTPSDWSRTSDANATILETQPGSPSTQTTIPGTQPAPPGTQGGAGVQPSPPHMQPSLHGAKKVPTKATPGTLGTQMDATSPKEGGKALPTTQLAQGGHPAVGTLSVTARGFEIPLDTDARAMSPSQEPAVPRGSSGSSSASSCYVETVEGLRQIGQLSNLYTALKEQVAHLEATKSDHAELEKLCRQFLEGDLESIASILADLQGQVASLQGLASDLQGEKGKVRQLEDALGKLGVVGADWKVDGSNQITLKLGSVLQEIKQELKELGEQQEMTKATLEQSVTKTADQLQEQLDKLRAMVEGMGQQQVEAHICSTDTSVQVGQLLQRYEKLQELVDSFMSRQTVGKVVRPLPGRSQQDEELLKRIQATVVQVQGDYEKLSSVMGNLVDEHHQKQKDIEALFQSLERLEKEKADKEDLLLGIDVKADKTALAGKVSRTQFDASMERLNEMIQEMLSRVMGQEQGWHRVQQQLSEEMDSKLDRLELGPFWQQLEAHWKSILEQLKKAPPVEADNAAGIKKQLLAHFHCVSCDRRLSMLVPGPHIVAIPSMPPLDPRVAGRPHTILKLEQTQQHGHRDRVAECRYPSGPRHCGGQHTLTHPLQRCPRLQPLQPSTPWPLQPPTLLPIKHDEMELLGQDGHIYRGRQDGQLPVLMGKEGFLRDKPKLSPRQQDTRDTGCRLSRPQSTGSSLSQLGTATSTEHRPASSHGHLSQALGLFPAFRDGSSTPTARWDWGSPAEPPPPRLPSRRASGSGQQQ